MSVIRKVDPLIVNFVRLSDLFRFNHAFMNSETVSLSMFIPVQAFHRMDGKDMKQRLERFLIHWLINPNKLPILRLNLKRYWFSNLATIPFQWVQIKFNIEHFFLKVLPPTFQEGLKVKITNSSTSNIHLFVRTSHDYFQWTEPIVWKTLDRKQSFSTEISVEKGKQLYIQIVTTDDERFCKDMEIMQWTILRVFQPLEENYKEEVKNMIENIDQELKLISEIQDQVSEAFLQETKSNLEFILREKPKILWC